MELNFAVEVLRPLASGARGALPLAGGICRGVTAGKSSHNASNARGVTAGKMGPNSSAYNLCTSLVSLTRRLFQSSVLLCNIFC